MATVSTGATRDARAIDERTTRDALGSPGDGRAGRLEAAGSRHQLLVLFRRQFSDIAGDQGGAQAALAALAGPGGGVRVGLVDAPHGRSTERDIT